MRAAMLREFGSPLELSDVTDPVAAADQAVVRVRAAGLCGTDLKVTGGMLPLTLPLIPGHEIAGEVVSVGADVDPSLVGKRVAVYYYDTCGRCFYCTHEAENLCTNVSRLGFEANGGLAEFVVAPAKNLLVIGNDVPFEQAAPAMDALTSPLKALEQELQLQTGETLAVVGAGGLGLNAIQVGQMLGARVAVVEPSDERRDLAAGMGAELCVPPERVDEIAAWSEGPGPDVVLEISGTAPGLATAEALVRPGGRLGLLGYSPKSALSSATPRIVLDEITVVGSRGGSLRHARLALDAIERGDLTIPIAKTVSLTDVEPSLDALRQGEVLGRIIVDPSI